MSFFYFAFFIPAIMLVFGIAFLIAARSGSLAARYWGFAHLAIAVAFGVPVLEGLIPIQLQALLADAFFLIGIVLHGQALLIRFGKPRLIRLQVGFALISYAAVAAAILIAGNLPLELGLHDAASCILWAFPLFVVASAVRKPIDWALVVATSLIILDTVIRNIVVYASVPASSGLETFSSSSYAIFMQATGAIIGLLYGLVALASVSVDLLGHYRRAAEIDPLTSLLNRRGLDEAVAELRASVRLSGAVLICDIDHFKRINDDFGHAVGDRVLVGISALLQRECGADDLIARYGGEEFVIYMPAIDILAAVQRAEAIRLEIANRMWSAEGLDRRVTASFGVAATAGDAGSISETLDRADMALYRAKSSGRNKVVIADKLSPVNTAKVTPLPWIATSR